MNTSKRWCLLMALYLSAQLSFGQTPTNDPNWNSTAVLADDFNSSETINYPSSCPSCTWQAGNFGAPPSIVCEEGPPYVFSTMSFTNVPGSLQIIATANSSGNCGMSSTNSMVSGTIVSNNTFLYGYFEAKCNMNTTGPSWDDGIFLLGQNCSGTSYWNEIDCEILGSNTSPYQVNNYSTNIHFNDASCTDNSVEQDYINSSIFNQFHTYSFEWSSNFITWYFDGTPIRTVGINNFGIPDHAMNLWLGPGSTSSSLTSHDVLPGYMDIDHVYVYQLKYDCTNPKTFYQNSDINSFVYEVKSSITFSGSSSTPINLASCTPPSGKNFVFRAVSGITLNSYFNSGGAAVTFLPTGCN